MGARAGAWDILGRTLRMRNPRHDPGHAHVQLAHDHTLTTQTHSHGVNDPGHSHSYQRAITAGNQKPASGGTAPFDTYDTPQTGGAGTGISIQAALIPTFQSHGFITGGQSSNATSAAMKRTAASSGNLAGVCA